MASVKQSSVDHKYLKPEQMGYDPAALQSGASAGEGKVWQHETVESGGGGWFQADAPGQNKASLPTEEAPAAPAGGGGAGAPVDTSGMAAAMAGLRSAAGPSQPPDPMAFAIAGPRSVNPNLGQRVPPINMRQLAMMLPRIY